MIERALLIEPVKSKDIADITNWPIMQISKMKAQLQQKYRYHKWWLSSQVNLNFDDCKIISVHRKVRFPRRYIIG
jgi:hypothetical protein